MNWFFLALIPPFLWATTNHIDKFLIEKYFKNSSMGTLIIFSSLIGLFVLPIIYLIEPNVFNVEFRSILILITSSVIYILATLFYVFALRNEEASIVVPAFQLIPVFGYFLGSFFLNEIIALNQIFASLLIIFGALLISLNLDEFGLIMIVIILQFGKYFGKIEMFS